MVIFEDVILFIQMYTTPHSFIYNLLMSHIPLAKICSLLMMMNHFKIDVQHYAMCHCWVETTQGERTLCLFN